MAVNSIRVVEVSQGIPGKGIASGGSEGQVIAKASTTDYDTEWVDLEASNVSVDEITGVTGTDVQTVLEELKTSIDEGGSPETYVETFNGRSGTVTPQTDDYSVSQITGAASEEDLTTAEDRITVTEADISTNTSNISTNTSNIATNVSSISTNSSAISTLESEKLAISDPTQDAEVKTLKVNETTDDAATLGAGTIRYNSTDSTIEYSDGTDWVAPSSSSSDGGSLQFKPLTVGYAGDSISGYWAGDNGLSGMFWYQNLFNPCLIERTFSTAHGGSPSSALISEYDGTTAQIEVLEALETKPDLMLVHTTQNDYFGSSTNAETEYLNVTEYCDRALTAGVKNIIVVGHPPKSGTDEPSVLAYLNQLLLNYCNSTEGVHFIDVLSLWRAIPTTEDASASGIAWRDGYSDDGTHPTSKAMYEAGNLLAPILNNLVQGKLPYPVTANSYDSTNYPYNNLLGMNGLFLGTNGEYNDVSNTDVAGYSSSSRWRIEDGNGVTATPSIVVGDDGYNYQQLVLSGTATAEQDVTLYLSFAYDSVPEATYLTEMMLELSSITGVEEIVIGTTTIGQAQLTNDTHNLTDASMHITFTDDYAGATWSTHVFAITLTVASGESPTGTIKLGRCGVYQQL